MRSQPPLPTIELGPPTDLDAFAFQQLLTTTPFLSNNSLYCNLLQCTHFADTSICAKHSTKLIAFISGYHIPTRPDTLFIWQAIVIEPYRKQGLAIRMIRNLLKRPSCQDIAYLEATIPDSNQASWALFNRLAKQLDAATKISIAFDKDTHFHGSRETEKLMRIGPLTAKD